MNSKFRIGIGRIRLKEKVGLGYQLFTRAVSFRRFGIDHEETSLVVSSWIAAKTRFIRMRENGRSRSIYGSEQDFWKRVRDEPYFGAEISEAMGRELSQSYAHNTSLPSTRAGKNIGF